MLISITKNTITDVRMHDANTNRSMQPLKILKSSTGKKTATISKIFIDCARTAEFSGRSSVIASQTSRIKLQIELTS